MRRTKRYVGRRGFLKAAGAAVVSPSIVTSKALGGPGGTPPASERIVMAGIGMGGQGRSDLGGFSHDRRVQVVAVCDVQYKALERWKNNKNVKTYTDYRETCARDDIDAIMFATPDHRHAQVTIDAMKSGKDVYCEKPLSLTIREGRKMVETARAALTGAAAGHHVGVHEHGDDGIVRGQRSRPLPWTARVRQVRIGHELAPLVRMEPGKAARIG